MPPSLFWLLALLVVLFFMARRFLRHGPTLTQYRLKQVSQQESMLAEIRRASAQEQDAEALLPALAAVRGMLPPGIAWQILPVPRAAQGGLALKLTLYNEQSGPSFPLLTLVVGHTPFSLAPSFPQSSTPHSLAHSAKAEFCQNAPYSSKSLSGKAPQEVLPLPGEGQWYLHLDSPAKTGQTDKSAPFSTAATAAFNNKQNNRVSVTDPTELVLPTPEPVECFDDLADFAMRLETLIARSLHDPV